MSDRASDRPDRHLDVTGHTLEITIRQVLGHLWGSHDECVLVVDAEIGGTVRQTMHIMLGTESEAQAVTAILNAHGYHVELTRTQPAPRPAGLTGLSVAS